MVPAIAVPSEDPRLDTERDSPEISPWRFSGKADCTTLADGVSMTPTPMPMRNSPGGHSRGSACVTLLGQEAN
jgi:hypothetical protein